jgi:signal transduction histidine kinase
MKILVVDDDWVTGTLNIIRMHNGSINCRSEPGMETVLTVRLPDSGGTG